MELTSNLWGKTMNHKKIPEPAHSSLCRRTFMKLIGQGTLGLGFGVLLFNRGLVFAAEAKEDEAHRLLMQGMKDFKGVKVAEITPNDMFYLTSYDRIPEVRLDGFSLRIEGLVKKPMSLKMDE
jgi:DMSO/TMAO reductase YedYZ molybdopterin-dependent catalytic subunit